MTTYEWEKEYGHLLYGGRQIPGGVLALERHKDIVKSYKNHIVASDKYAFIALMDDKYYVKFSVKRTSLMD